MKTLLELSREKIHAYRDEARLTDIPDKDMPDHLHDERTDRERSKRRRGIQNASDALQRKHKEEAKKAKEERKNKPPKPKKPDSRLQGMTLRKAAKLGSLWSEEKKMIEEGNKENKAKKNATILKYGKDVLQGLNARFPGRELLGRIAHDKNAHRRVGRQHFSQNNEETDMTQVNEYKYGSTHEFRGNEAFMDQHAEKILKKHGVQIHSVELLPDEKEVIFHVSGSVDGINKASSALYDAANGKEHSKPIAYKPPKFQGSMRKMMQEETTEETEMEDTEEQEMTQEDILAEGPQAILAGIATEDPEVEHVFNAVMGAKIDSILDGLRNELAAGMFEAPEEETVEEVASEETEEEGEVIEEEQIDEISKGAKDRYAAALPMSIAKNAGNAAEAGHIGRGDLKKRFEHKALKRVEKASALLTPKPKTKKEKK
jgi:hypothetical protein